MYANHCCWKLTLGLPVICFVVCLASALSFRLGSHGQTMSEPDLFVSAPLLSGASSDNDNNNNNPL